MGENNNTFGDWFDDYIGGTYSGVTSTTASISFSNYSFRSNISYSGAKEYLFLGIWMDFQEWKKAIHKCFLETKWPKKLIPTGIVNGLQKSFRKKLPSWSSRRWKSKT